jgi:hypothetical protein
MGISTQRRMLTAFFAFSQSTLLICDMIGERLSLGFYRSDVGEREDMGEGQYNLAMSCVNFSKMC